MEVSFGRALEDKLLLHRYIDEAAGRLYAVYGGCIFSVPICGSIRDMTRFGYRVTNSATCALVCSEFGQRPQSQVGTPPDSNYVFTDHLGLVSGQTQIDLMNRMTIELKGPTLCHALIGFPIPERIKIQLGEINLSSNKLVLYSRPILTNAATGFRYKLAPGVLTLCQANIFSLPEQVASELDDVFQSSSLQREPIKDLYKTEICILGPRALDIITVPPAESTTPTAENGSVRKRAVVSDHVQVKHITRVNDVSAPRRRRGRKKNGGAITEADTGLTRLWAVIQTIDGALKSSNGALDFFNLLDQKDNDFKRATSHDAARICGLPGPGQRAFNSAPWSVTTTQKYAVILFLLKVGMDSNKFDQLECFCAKNQANKSSSKRTSRMPSIDENSVADMANGIMIDMAIIYSLIEAVVTSSMTKHQPGSISSDLMREAEYMIDAYASHKAPDTIIGDDTDHDLNKWSSDDRRRRMWAIGHVAIALDMIYRGTRGDAESYIQSCVDDKKLPGKIESVKRKISAFAEPSCSLMGPWELLNRFVIYRLLYVDEN